MVDRTHVILVLAGVLAGAFWNPGATHAQSPVSQGQRVRVTMSGYQTVGMVSQIDEQSLGLIVDGSTVAIGFALTEVQGLERSIGQRHKGKKWGTYGALAGGGLGLISGLTWASWGAGSIGLTAGLYVGAVNAIWIGGAGYLAGFFLGKYDIWQAVDLGRSQQQALQLVEPGSGGRNPEVSPVLIGASIPLR